ncbi:MAG: C39 family peptidase [Lachnospiraceae bacterium]|nr:C39 family peptidase [Lachnospiraceae bacterium]
MMSCLLAWGFTMAMIWSSFQSARSEALRLSREEEDVLEVSMALEDGPGGTPYQIEESLDEVMTGIELRELPVRCMLDVPFVYQEPELPTGCESVALTMLLLYEGFDLEKTTIADDYLLYSENGDFSEGYIGDPYSCEGAGCFPPSLVRTANLFLKEHGSVKQAVNLSGRSLEELFHYLADGIPVAVWGTQYMADTWIYEMGFEEDGIEYHWYENEHCVVLSGYDLEKEILMVNDSLEGVVERDLESFAFIYNETGQYALAIL